MNQSQDRSSSLILVEIPEDFGAEMFVLHRKDEELKSDLEICP